MVFVVKIASARLLPLLVVLLLPRQSLEVFFWLALPTLVCCWIPDKSTRG
jgi:hypothetical protein